MVNSISLNELEWHRNFLLLPYAGCQPGGEYNENIENAHFKI